MIFAAWFYLYIGSNIVETAFFSFLFPQNYWFICALVILYPLYYIAIKCPLKNRKYIYTAVLVVLYAVIYAFLDKSRYMVETIEFYAIRVSYFFSFFLMLLGADFKKHFQEICEILHKKRMPMLAAFFGSIILYFGFILLMGRFKGLYKIQFFETILCITTSSLLFLFVMLSENDIVKKKDSRLLGVMSFLGSCTLEIYLVQFPIIDYVGALPVFSGLKFIIAVSVIIASAYVLKLVSGYVIRKIG